MAHPVDGLKAKITSWTAGGSEDSKYLISTAITPVEMTVNYDGDVQEATPLDGAQTAMGYMGGLFSGTLDFSGLWPKGAYRLGNTGAITLDTGSYYSYFAESWFLDLEWGEEDITTFPAESAHTSGASKRFMPKGLLTWSGGFTCRTSSATAIGLPSAANNLGIAAVFKLSETGTLDAGFSGTVLIKSASQSVRPSDQIKVNYTFNGSGDLTSILGDALPGILPTGVVDQPDWDTNDDGSPDNILTAQTYTGRTIVGAAFLRRLRIECNVGQPVKISGTARFSDGVTLA